MIELPKNIVLQMRHGGIKEDDIKDYLMVNYNMSQIVDTCAELLIRYTFSVNSRIAISQEDFDNHFRIIGVKADGTLETRGRRKKETDLELGL